MGEAVGHAAPTWRSTLLALCLLPVALPLLLLCLPLLCVAVAAVRFRRRRRKLMGRSGCRVGRGGWAAAATEDGEGHRDELLRKYLQDQMELVGDWDGGAVDRSWQRRNP
ncbi:hypothetical protein HU200_029143 [Digitaria exilis]|uniref:Uncharacterized protein n=1 Tax=Digitaria exilis TaxID=1010633 RepID=A0A835ET38_9POAL|nr:hypothetical protein HU200_029143 [Digitaria exilis]CAB3489310.1 unnamed protein product [Digitaria exilis]